MTQFVSNGGEREIRLQGGVRKSACIFETTTQKTENRIILKRIFKIIKTLSRVFSIDVIFYGGEWEIRTPAAGLPTLAI